MNCEPCHERLALAELQGHLRWPDLALQGLMALLEAAGDDAPLTAGQVRALLAPVADGLAEARRATEAQAPR